MVRSRPYARNWHAAATEPHALRPKLPILPQTRQMWKTCQAFRLRYESFLPHSTPLPPLYAQRYLACFGAGLGILIIEGKEEISAPTDPKPKAARARPFPFPEVNDGTQQHGARRPALPTPHRGYQNAPATAPFSATCHSQKRPSRKPRRCKNMPHPTPRGEGGISYRLQATAYGLGGYRLRARPTPNPCCTLRI
jgi:hypothetical protein